MQRSLFYLWLIFVIVGSGVSCSQEPADESTDKAAEAADKVAEAADEAAIREVMQKYAQGFKLPNDRERIYGEILSDTGWVSVAPDPENPGRARVFNKQTALEYMKNWPKMENYEYQTQTIQVFGPIAYEVENSCQTLPDGKKTNKMEKIHFFAKEDTGWKLMFYTPAGPVRQTLKMKPKPWDQYEEFSRIERNNAEDEAAIRALIAKAVSARYLDTPSEVLREILSDNGFSCAMPRPDDPSRALIFNKESICRHRDDIAPNVKSQQYSQQIDSLQIWGPLAYLHQTLTITAANGREVKQEGLGFLAKEKDGWKFIYAAEAANVQKALQATDSKGKQTPTIPITVDDETEIRKLIEKYTNPWKFGNLKAVYQEILSEKAFVYLQPASKQNRILDKPGAIKLYAKSTKPKDLAYTIQSIQIFGPVGYEVGTSEFRNTRGRIVRRVMMHFLAKDETGWKFIGAFSARPIREALQSGANLRVSTLVSAADAKEQMAIRRLFEKVHRAWNSPGEAALVEEILSDQAFVFSLPHPRNPAIAAVANKKVYCEFFPQERKANPQIKHGHKIHSITIDGPLAYEIGTTIITDADGQEMRFEVLNILVREKGSWKFVFSTSVDQVRETLFGESTDIEEQKLRTLARKYAKVFASENPTPFDYLEEILTKDFLAVCSDGTMLPDKSNTLKFYRKALDEIRQELNSLQIKFDIHSVRVFKETACVFGKIRMQGDLKESGQTLDRHIWETLIFRKVNGQWKLCQEHSTRAKADPDQP